MNYVTYYIPSLLNMLPINFINYDGSFPTFYIFILINKLLAVIPKLLPYNFINSSYEKVLRFYIITNANGENDSDLNNI